MERLDHYTTLGVERTASADQIRTAYRARASKLHPDRVVDPAERSRAETQMAAVNEAWRVLGDPALRTVYDRGRRPDPPLPSAQPGPIPWPSATGPFDDVEVTPTVGCVLRFGPVLAAIGVLLGLLIVTALATGGGDLPTRLSPGRCVELDEGLRVVPCIVGTPRIVSRGVAGTSCPAEAVAVVLTNRTDQVCLAPYR